MLEGKEIGLKINVTGVVRFPWFGTNGGAFFSRVRQVPDDPAHRTTVLDVSFVKHYREVVKADAAWPGRMKKTIYSQLVKSHA
jgi:hypothetical protein